MYAGVLSSDITQYFSSAVSFRGEQLHISQNIFIITFFNPTHNCITEKLYFEQQNLCHLDESDIHPWLTWEHIH